MFELRDAPIAAQEAIDAVAHPGAGGIDVFVGIVRAPAAALEYSAYAPMAVAEMRRIADAIAGEIPGARLAALHRVGLLRVGEVAVVCAASAPHRAEAFDACRRLIDRIKERVPIWKREDGAWVNPLTPEG